jgi:hypothetical protein
VFGAAAEGEHIVAADEDIQLADTQLIAYHFDGVEHHEQRIAVLLELGSLVAVACVLDGERVQVELLLHLGKLALGGVLERHPHEAAGAREIVADLVLVDVRELAAVLVHHAIDQHGAA